MSDSWRRMPNPAGYEYGPRYVREIAGLQFVLTPHWRRRNRFGKEDGKGPKDEFGATMVRAGYEIDGLPGVGNYNVAPTLAEAKQRCESFAQEVAEGKVNPATGERR